MHQATAGIKHWPGAVGDALGSVLATSSVHQQGELDRLEKRSITGRRTASRAGCYTRLGTGTVLEEHWLTHQATQ
jgi:hypothetical protein